MIQIDLRAPSISPARKIWRLFPGSNYKFLEEFFAQDVAFLDFPGIELPAGRLQDNFNTLVPRIVASQRTAENLKHVDIGVDPIARWEQFQFARTSKARGKLRQASINFFDLAERGDFVVVPSTMQTGRVSIGMFPATPENRVNGFYPRRYQGVQIPARPIRWLRHVDEHQLSPKLTRVLRHQHPFSLLERTMFDEVYSLVFSNYRYQDRHSAVVFNTEADYLDQDAALIGLISKLAAQYSRAVDDQDAIDAEIDPFQLFFAEVPIEYACSQVADIHSPGFNRFTSTKITPLVIAAVLTSLIALAGCSARETIGQDRQNIEYINSNAAPDDPCTWKVSKASADLLDSMSDELLWKACIQMRDAQRRAGIETKMSISEVPIPRQRPEPDQ